MMNPLDMGVDQLFIYYAGYSLRAENNSKCNYSNASEMFKYRRSLIKLLADYRFISSNASQVDNTTQDPTTLILAI